MQVTRGIKAGVALAGATVVVAGSVGIGAAVASSSAAKQPTHPSATFTMYADVDAEGDLGSNYDAVKVTRNALENYYDVTFTQRVGACASTAQPGKAGGPDPVNAYVPIVENEGDYTTTKTLRVSFIDDRNGGAQLPDPFMLTVVCRYLK